MTLFMKKMILGVIACLGIALFFAINVSINLSKDHSTSGLALMNIEALAEGEVPGEGGSFPTPSDANDEKYAYRNAYMVTKGGKHLYTKRQSENYCIGQDKSIPNVKEYVYKCF